MKNIFLAAFCVVLLASCATRKAPRIYTLKPAESTYGASCKLPNSIKILEPNAAPGMESFNIAVIDGNSQTRYRGVAWNGTLPKVVQSYFAESFESSGVFPNVSTDNDSIRTSWLMETRLKGMFVDKSANRNDAVTSLTISLINASDRKTVTSLPAERRSDITGKNMEQVAATFNQQLGEISSDILIHFAKVSSCRK